MARPRTNGRKAGPETKRTPETERKLLAAIATGMPIRFSAASVGISAETLYQWRDRDPMFEAAVKKAQAEAVAYRWEEIRKAGVGTKDKPGNWSALAWQLERGYPHEFGRPEVQLHQFNQQNVTNNVLSITVEQAGEFERRSKPICDEIDQLLEARRKRLEEREAAEKELGQDKARIVDAQAEIIDAITLPPGEPSAAWWSSLSKGDSGRGIERKAFMHAFGTVAVKLLGVQRASQLELDLGDEELFLRDLHASLQDMGGPQAWEVLLALGGSS